MSTLIVSTFPDAWALVVDLEPDVRTIRRIRGVKPPTLHQITLSPADAARLDLGDYALAAKWEEYDAPEPVTPAPWTSLPPVRGGRSDTRLETKDIIPGLRYGDAGVIHMRPDGTLTNRMKG